MLSGLSSPQRLPLLLRCKLGFAAELHSTQTSTFAPCSGPPENVLPSLSGDISDERSKHLAKLVRGISPGLSERFVSRAARRDVGENAKHLKGAAPRKAIQGAYYHNVPGSQPAQELRKNRTSVLHAAFLLGKYPIAVRSIELGQLGI
jgi:hypothetical protein